MRGTAAFTQEECDVVAVVNCERRSGDLVVMDVGGRCRRVAVVCAGANVDTGGSALKAAAGHTVVHPGDTVIADRDVYDRRQKRGAVAVVERENAGILADIGDRISNYLHNAVGTVFRVNVDGASGNVQATAADVPVVVDPALD